MAKNHFEPGAYSNTSSIRFPALQLASRNTTTGREYGDIEYQTDSYDIRLFYGMLEGNNTGAGRYQDLTPSQCTNIYNTDFMSTHRNLFLITSHNSSGASNNTLLDWIPFSPYDTSPSRWMCSGNPPNLSQGGEQCNPNELASNVTRGLPWEMRVGGRGVVEITGCKSEKTVEKCKVQFSLGIMIAVICCNFVKACGMIMTVVRSREPTLVTLGDAIDSFLRIPDPTTRWICYADRCFIEKEWRRGWWTEPRQWKQKGVQRWWTSVGQRRWITCIIFFLITIFAAGVLLQVGLGNDGGVWSTDLKSM